VNDRLPRPPRAILCCGNISLDIAVRSVEHFTWGTTTWVDSIQQNMGGNGSNTSYTLGMLGVPVRLLGMVGRDEAGERVLSILRAAGVDLEFVGRSKGHTTTTVCLVKPDGNRLFLQQLGSSAEVYPEPIEFTGPMLEGSSHYHQANVFSLPNMRRSAPETLRRAREAGLTPSLDTGWDVRGRWIEDIAGCLPFLDLLFMNQDEARLLSGEADPELAARRMQSLGAGDVVIKLGAEGCAVFTKEEAARFPAFEVEAVDTTGAGDCFVAGFLAALSEGQSYAGAARFANAVGAMSVQSLGAMTGIRSRAETEEWLRTAVLRSGVSLPVAFQDTD
jgi:sugar/nucleoside kinase (ribokinase family)